MPELAAAARASSRLPRFDVPASDWCERANTIAADSVVRLSWRAAFRLGDAVLELASDCDALIGELADHYSECEVSLGDPQAATLPRIRCTVRTAERARLVLLRFESPPAAAPIDIALGLLKHPATNPEYTEGAPLADGWRTIVHAATGTPAAAARRNDLIIDLPRVGTRLLCRLLIDAVLGLQRTLLFAHAASVGIGGAGVLLVGPSGSGKTTTAVSLASRGHRYFGDDVAAIRLQSAELLPFWRIAHMRPGPHARSLESHFAEGVWDAPYTDGLPRLRLRVADAFPNAAGEASSPLPLARVLFLRRFAARPRIERFTPQATHFAAGSRFALNNTLWVAWGTSPRLRLLQFVAFLRLLERVPCAWLDAGEPEATADLIEHGLEDTCH